MLMSSFRALVAVLVFLHVGMSASSAGAQGSDDREYVFGTRLVILSPTSLVGQNYGWWADKLPMPYTHAAGWIVLIVNEARQERGIEKMVDYKRYPVAVGMETPKEGVFEYNIDFQNMSPADVEVVLERFPLSGELEGLETQLRPMPNGYFYGNSQDGSAVVMELPSGPVTLETDVSFDEAWAKIADNLQSYVGREVKFDLSMNRYKAAGGYDSFDVNVTVYMDESWETAVPYYPGEYD